ncbi:MAG: choice-of-anchor Q domain-containing protein, partial [Ilumatobacteraceae bacterium]
LTVQGPGASAITISGENSSRIFYLYNSADTPIDVTISGLGFIDGNASIGGAIRAKGENLVVESSRFEANYADYSGGAISFDADYVEPIGLVGTLRIDDTVFLYNDAVSHGGAVYVHTGIDTIVITDSTFQANAAGWGAALSFQEVNSVEITDSVLTGNDAKGHGGGAYFYELTGDLDIVRTTIDGNHALSSKGAGGGVYVYTGSTVSIDSSTISNNSSGGAGGGVYLDFAHSFEVVNSTISGNSADWKGGGLSVLGTDFAAEIRHSTITENYGGYAGGGIAFYTAALTLDHSVVSANDSDKGNQDIEMYDGPLNADWSIIGDTGLVGGANNIVTNIPGLSPLADNGGPTKTHKPAAASPAIDNGDPAIAGAPEFDQRGEDRVYFVIDIGAVEAGSPAVDDEYSVDEDGSLNEGAPGVMDNDLIEHVGEVALVNGPAHGTLTLDADGSFVYTPTANFHGTDSFQYSLLLTNPKKPSAEAMEPLPTATVTITVNPVNDPPQAIGDTASVVAGVA